MTSQPMTYDSLPADFKRLYRTTEKNAGQRGINFALSRGEFATLVAHANGRCQMTSILFDWAKPDGKWGRRPYAASLDRTDNTKGYTGGNCRLVCVAVNLALNTWGELVLFTIARALVGGDGLRSHPTRAGKLRGVTRTNAGTFSARAAVCGKVKHLGTFSSQSAAMDAYAEAHGLSTKPATDIKDLH